MKFGMLLLGLLALYATAGTLIPQGQTLSYYRENYDSTVFFIIEKLKLYKVYESIYFISLTALLTLNLLFCTLRRIPSARAQYQKEGDASLHLKKNHQIIKELNEGTHPKELLKSLGFGKIKELEEQGQKIYFSSRRRAGYFGSTLVHLGLLFVIVAFALGKIMGYESFVRGIPAGPFLSGRFQNLWRKPGARVSKLLSGPCGIRGHALYKNTFPEPAKSTLCAL